jgi:hypothetical protein
MYMPPPFVTVSLFSNSRYTGDPMFWKEAAHCELRGVPFWMMRSPCLVMRTRSLFVCRNTRSTESVVPRKFVAELSPVLPVVPQPDVLVSADVQLSTPEPFVLKI